MKLSPARSCGSAWPHHHYCISQMRCAPHPTLSQRERDRVRGAFHRQSSPARFTVAVRIVRLRQSLPLIQLILISLCRDPGLEVWSDLRVGDEAFAPGAFRRAHDEHPARAESILIKE